MGRMTAAGAQGPLGREPIWHTLGATAFGSVRLAGRWYGALCRGRGARLEGQSCSQTAFTSHLPPLRMRGGHQALGGAGASRA